MHLAHFDFTKGLRIHQERSTYGHDGKHFLKFRGQFSPAAWTLKVSRLQLRRSLGSRASLRRHTMKRSGSLLSTIGMI
jgi:hypothetical protein